MPAWILITILILFVVGVLVLMVAVFTEMGTKRKTGSMKSKKTQHKSRKK